MSTQQDATVVVHVNDQEAEDKVRSLQERAKQLRQEFANAVKIGDKGTIAATEKELKKVNKELNNASLRAGRIRDAMKHLSQATPKELHNTLKLINQELNSGAIPRGSKQWKAYQEQIKKVNAELKKIQSETREVADSSKNRLANVANLAVSIFTGMHIFDEVAGKLRGFVNAYAEHDAAMANTQKFTGMARESVEELNDEFKKMDTRTSLNGLNELAQAAGRLGKNSIEDVMGFVRAGDIIGVAMDELGADAPQIISQLAGIFNLESELGTEKAMLAVGSAINTLSQNCAASAPNLVDFASRLGAVANSTNMSMDEMLAFGALLDDQKVSVEKSATAMQTVLTKMYAEPTKFAKTAGLDADLFTAALKRSSTEGVMMFVDSLAQMDSMEQAATLKNLHVAGAGVVQTFQTLAGKSDMLREQLGISATAFREAASATDEFNVQNNTVQAELDKLQKKSHEMSVAIGEKLLPVIKGTISGTTMLLSIVKTMIGFVVEHKTGLLSLTAGYVAYTVAVHAATIKTTALNIVEKASIVIKRGVAAATHLASAATALFSGNVKKAAVAWRAFNIALKTSSIGIIVGIIAAVATGLLLITRRTNDAAEAQKSLNKIQEDANVKMAEEKNNIENLIAAAQNEKLTLDERKKAIEKLNGIIPNYNAHLDATTGKYVANKQALDDYLASLAKKYELEGAKEELSNIGSQTARLKAQKAEAEKTLNAAKNNTTPSGPSPQTSGGAVVPHSYHANIANSGEIHALESKINDIDEELRTLESKREIITSIYGTDLNRQALNAATIPTNVSTPTPIDEKEEDRKRKAAEKAAKEAEKAAKEALKKELESKKASRDQEHAENLAAYSTGLKTYLEYIEKKHEIDANALAEQKKVLESRNLTETDEYAKLLKVESELNAKHLETQARLKKEQLDDEHKAATNEITQKYLDPHDTTYSSERSYRQALLELDIDYLKRKQALYLVGSKEYEDVQREINERVGNDQLQKQRETAEAVRAFIEQYGTASGSEREANELAMLDEVYAQGLISEEIYNKAKNGIKEKYRNEDLQRERVVQSEYADMAYTLYSSFSKFFAELGEEGGNFWNNLSDAAGAAFALMSAGLQQYTAYANAERDLELAKVEKNYDAEIEAAGSNSKKKAALEKEKEAKIAEIKKKHNERAMKIELAQAIAQTAMSAIAAYASAAAIPIVGWVMGPIAAALAVAAGAVQIATIKKQHQAEALGYYEGGFTGRSTDNHKEVGVVHANEFVANHKAVANPRLRPLFSLLDSAQKANTVGSLTANDVSNALGQGKGVATRAAIVTDSADNSAVVDVMATTTVAIERLNKRIDDGIETVMVMDGERGFAKKYDNYQKLIKRAKG